MNTISELENRINIGNEIEFVIDEDEFSITYSYENNKKKIQLCKFYDKPILFDDFSDLLKTTAINNTEFSELWVNAAEIFVY